MATMQRVMTDLVRLFLVAIGSFFFVWNLTLTQQCGIFVVPVPSIVKEEEALSHIVNINNNNSIYDLTATCRTAALVEQWKANVTAIAKALSPEDELPSKRRPFIFIHLRKAGGVTLRNQIGQAASQYNLSYWIPCFGRPCMPFSIPPGTERYDVYASHLEYHSAMNVLGEVDFAGVGHTYLEPKYLGRLAPDQKPIRFMQQFSSTKKPFSCMTRLRETVDRVASCWNYLNVQNQNYPNPPAHELEDTEWEEVLKRVDCSNEIVRMFGSTADMGYFRTAQPCDGHAITDVEKILRRMSSCIMTLNSRCEESKEIVEVFLPWLADSYQCEVTNNKGTIEKMPLSKASAAAIRKANQYDDYLFQFGEALFEAQLRRARELRQQAPTEQAHLVPNNR